MKQINIFDEVIEECCSNPITGFFRDGFCHTDELDRGLHVVCAQITDEFLDFSKSRGNDLSINELKEIVRLIVEESIEQCTVTGTMEGRAKVNLKVEGEVVAKMTCDFEKE